MIFIFILTLHSMFCGYLLAKMIFVFDKKHHKSNAYFLIRLAVIFILSITNGYLIQIWPEEVGMNHIYFVIAQGLPGVLVFLFFWIRRKR